MLKNKILLVLLVIILPFSILFLFWYYSNPDNLICLKKTSVIKINNNTLSIINACSNQEKENGLMYIKNLPSNVGMLFVFDNESYLSFWMKNTLIDLDVAFIDKNFKIIDIQNMKANTLINHTSKEKSLYALEVNSNYFKSKNIKIGDYLKFQNYKTD